MEEEEGGVKLAPRGRRPETLKMMLFCIKAGFFLREWKLATVKLHWNMKQGQGQGGRTYFLL